MYSQSFLSLEEARIVGEAALAKAMESKGRPMAIAVVDAVGELVYFVKMDKNFPFHGVSPKMAINKAYTAGQWGMDTADVVAFLKAGGRVIGEFPDPRFTTVPGGICLRAPDSSVIGAIGAAGRAPNVEKVADQEVALAGAQALSFR